MRCYAPFFRPTTAYSTLCEFRLRFEASGTGHRSCLVLIPGKIIAHLPPDVIVEIGIGPGAGLSAFAPYSTVRF
jgi:hypothetical protein